MNIEKVKSAYFEFQKFYNIGNEIISIRRFFEACGVHYEFYSKIDEKIADFIAMLEKKLIKSKIIVLNFN